MKIQLLHQSVKSSAVHSIEKNGNDSNDFQAYQESGNFGLGVAVVVCIKHHSIKKYHTAHSHSSWNLKDRYGLAAELPAKKSGRSAQTLQVIKYIGIIQSQCLAAGVGNDQSGSKAYDPDKKEGHHKYRKGIQLFGAVKDPELWHVVPEHPEICAVFGNALDNAMEAVEGFPEEKRRITMEARWKRGLLAVSIRNPGRIPERDSRIPKKFPITTKKDRASHGFGIPSIRAVLGRYGGTMELRQEGDGVCLFLYCHLQKENVS